MTRTPTVLIIDDNVNLVRGLASVLRTAGYNVHTSYTAADGLNLARMHDPDAIVLDYKMPMINGAGFLYRLRELEGHRETPVMIVTGATIDDEQHAEFRELHAMVKSKPITAQTFLDEIATLISSRDNAETVSDAVNNQARC